PAALIRVALVEQPAYRDIDVVRVAEETFAVRGRELERLRVAVEEPERAGTERAEVVALEQVQGHRHERSLRPRPARVAVDAAIGRVRRRLDPDVLVPQVLLRDRAAGLAHERGDLPRDVAFVERVPGGHDRRGAPGLRVRALDGDEAAEECAE